MDKCPSASQETRIRATVTGACEQEGSLPINPSGHRFTGRAGPNAKRGP
jgi:hypothetical protein